MTDNQPAPQPEPQPTTVVLEPTTYEVIKKSGDQSDIETRDLNK